MQTPTIQVTIVDSVGARQTFQVGRLDLDCGPGGSIDIRPGKPAFCRGFESGVLTLDDGITVTTLNLTHGTASLNGDAVHVICERAATMPAALPLLLETTKFPAQPAGSKDNKQQTTNYTI